MSPATARLLRSLQKPGVEPPRQVKVGSMLVREHRGVLHEVIVVPRGFLWRGATHDSLSTIARKITGVSWNGPRFFGLRLKGEVNERDGEAPARGAEAGRAGKPNAVGEALSRIDARPTDLIGTEAEATRRRRGRRSSLWAGTARAGSAP